MNTQQKSYHARKYLDQASPRQKLPSQCAPCWNCGTCGATSIPADMTWQLTEWEQCRISSFHTATAPNHLREREKDGYTWQTRTVTYSHSHSQEHRERERERERQTDRQTDRDRDIDIDRKTQTDTDRERQRDMFMPFHHSRSIQLHQCWICKPQRRVLLSASYFHYGASVNKPSKDGAAY